MALIYKDSVSQKHLRLKTKLGHLYKNSVSKRDMRYTRIYILIVLIILLTSCGQIIAQKHIQHFIYFGLDRDRIRDTSFLNNEHIIGAQLKYMWRELESTENHYNLNLIQDDLDFLTSHGKKLFVQLQDVTFDTARHKPIPDYLIDKQYHGGVNIQYETDDHDEIIRQEGYLARRWDPLVAERFNKLLIALGNHFDGKIEGINLPETSAGFGNSGKLYPQGFTPIVYRDAIIKYMTMAKKAFPYSIVIQYANFMPGEWPHRADKSHLQSLYEFATKNNIGMGGPDILVYQKPHMNHSYKFLREYTNSITSGVAVQDGNYEVINPATGKQVTIKEIYDFANDYLGLDYIFWCTQEPYYTNVVLPFLKTIH